MKRNILTHEQLESLTTPRLLAYKNSLLKCNEGPHWDEDGPGWDKQCPEWQEHYKLVKEILANRPHIDKK